MEYRQLGKSGLQVSVIGLGTNNFGRTVDAKGTALVVSHALDLGINTVDTSNSYGGTLSEEYLGRALKAVAICTATWSDVGLEALPHAWWSLATGAPDPSTFSLNAGCIYDTADPVNTPLILPPAEESPWMAIVDGLPCSGE